MGAYDTQRHISGPLYHCSLHNINQAAALINQTVGPLTTFDRSTGAHRTVAGLVSVHAEQPIRWAASYRISQKIPSGTLGKMSSKFAHQGTSNSGPSAGGLAALLFARCLRGRQSLNSGCLHDCILTFVSGIGSSSSFELHATASCPSPTPSNRRHSQHAAHKHISRRRTKSFYHTVGSTCRTSGECFCFRAP